MTLAAALACALLLDAVLGEPNWLWSRVAHPAVIMGRLIGWLDKTFNRGKHRRAKGAACMLIAAGSALIVGFALSLFGPVVEVLCAAILLAQRSLTDHVAAVAKGLRQSLSEGRQAVSMIVSRDTADMDETRTARAAIESAAENLSDGVIAPALWFLVGGLPAMLTYKMINTADSMIGYRTPRHEAFGWASARTDDLINLLPARITALLIATAAWQRNWRAIRADARLHKSPNAGWPEAAMSRALGIALAGPRAYDGTLQDFPWVNSAGRKTLSADDIDGSVAVLWKAWGIMFTLCVVSAILL